MAGSNMRNSTKCSKRGMTLVEVLIAFVVLGVGFAGALTMVSMANKSAVAAANQAGAVHLVREDLETMRQYAINDPMMSIGLHTIATGRTYNVQLIGVTNVKSIAMSCVWSNPVLKTVQTATVTTIFVSALHN